MSSNFTKMWQIEKLCWINYGYVIINTDHCYLYNKFLGNNVYEIILKSNS
jgi:hypothetical protein